MPVSMGLSMSDVIRIMLTHQVVLENTLPFDTMVPNSTTTAAMQDATDGKPESFDGIEELIEDLKTQD